MSSPMIKKYNIGDMVFVKHPDGKCRPGEIVRFVPTFKHKEVKYEVHGHKRGDEFVSIVSTRLLSYTDKSKPKKRKTKKPVKSVWGKVTLGISFEDLLRVKTKRVSENERRKRWAEWLKLTRKEDNNVAKYWTDKQGCIGCTHLHGSWCKKQMLPCTVNPILTTATGVIGMACMGIGKLTL